MKKILLIRGIVSSVSFGLLFVFLINVDPTDRPIVYILIPVILAWIGLFFGLQAIAVLLVRRKSRVTSIICAVVSSTAVLLLLLSGVGDVGAVEAVLLLSLASLISFYVNRSFF